MTDSTSGSIRHRWWHRAIPVGVAVLLAVGVTAGPALATTTPAGPTLSLPAPTGNREEGTVRLHLVDHTRIDPTSPTHGVRELMVQVWYSATDTRDFPPAPYQTPLAAAHFLATSPILPGTTLPATIGHVGAPANRRHGPDPVVLYSPGAGNDGNADTNLVEDLVSHGYIVVTMDETNESPEVEFPGGRLVTGTFTPNSEDDLIKIQRLRAADAEFVLNELTVLNNGGNPDAEHTPLPAGLAGDFDLSRVGMFGWSIGGAASAQTMHDDPRIKAGIDMDGTFRGPLAQEGVRRPFLLMTDAAETEQVDPSLAPFLAASTGPKLHLSLANSREATFTDFEEFTSAIDLSPADLLANFGTIDPRTAVTDERAYIRAFFDKYLRGRDSHLLDGPSRRFPDISFEP